MERSLDRDVLVKTEEQLILAVLVCESVLQTQPSMSLVGTRPILHVGGRLKNVGVLRPLPVDAPHVRRVIELEVGPQVLPVWRKIAGAGRSFARALVGEGDKPNRWLA